MKLDKGLELKKLRERENQLKSIIDKRFSNENEYKLFVEENKETLQEIQEIKNAIKSIEWELMTDEEKEAHLKYLKDLKEKFKVNNARALLCPW